MSNLFFLLRKFEKGTKRTPSGTFVCYFTKVYLILIPAIEGEITYFPGLLIPIRMDLHSFYLLDPDPGGKIFQIKTEKPQGNS